MSQLNSLESEPLDELARRCAQETANFQRGRPVDTRFCFEMFRRAVCQTDANAWQALYHEYEPEVTGWVRRHPMFPLLEEEAEYFANRAFERLWSILKPEKWERFPDLKAVLRYLQMCVHSVLVDYARQKELAKQTESIDVEDAGPLPDRSPSPEEQTAHEERRRQLWDWLGKQLSDEREYRAIYDRFVLGLRPAEIAERSPDLYADVRELYRVTESVMNRLRRSPELESYLMDL